MRRSIIEIDEEKCTGCGLCVTACAEGALQIINGKAKLVSDIYCDGLGACIGECPEGALKIIEREADAFDEEVTKEHLEQLRGLNKEIPCGCPGSMLREIIRQEDTEKKVQFEELTSELTNWPVQLRLVSPTAPYFKRADLLLVADCVPFAYANFHSKFLKNKPLVIGCPKLDDAPYYVEKLSEIIKNSSIKSITVVHMEVPCCSGLSIIANRAIALSGKNIPINDYTISISGEILENTKVIM